VRDALDDPRGPHGSDVLHRPLGESFRIDEVLGEVESHYLELALRQTAGNKARAASLLGLNNPTTLANRLRKHGIAT
jgi:DNA-binding NtrC family response regulator